MVVLPSYTEILTLPDELVLEHSICRAHVNRNVGAPWYREVGQREQPEEPPEPRVRRPDGVPLRPFVNSEIEIPKSAEIVFPSSNVRLG